MGVPQPIRAPLVVHVIQHLLIGGLENGIVNLINRSPSGRVRHAVVCLSHYSDFRNRIEQPDVPVLALHKRPGKDPAHYVRLWRALRALRPSIVHTRNIGTIECAAVARAVGVPVTVHGEHGWEMSDLHGANAKLRRYRRWMRPFITEQVAVSRHMAEWLVEVVGVDPRRVVQIHNGVDTARFAPRGEAPAPAVTLPFEGSDLCVVGTVGRMQQVKDPVTLAAAFARAVRRDMRLAARLRLVMTGDGPLRADVERRLASEGVLHLAWLPGARDDIAAVLRALDVFVLPSLNEGISNVILEAMATGLPVIATRVGGNPELVADGEEGRLVPSGDVDAMADAIGAYAAAPELARRHGRNARARALRDFSLDVMVERYLSLYERLLGRA